MSLLASILADHVRWLSTGGALGRRADFGSTADHYVLFTDDGRSVVVQESRRFNQLREELRQLGVPGADLRQATFVEADIPDTDFRAANLQGAIFDGANLRGSVLAGAQLRDASMARANLRAADCEGADFTGANLESAQLDGANLRKATLAGTRLDSAVLVASCLEEADCSGASLRRANLSNSNVARTLLVEAVLDHGILTAAVGPDIVLRGASLRYAIASDAQFDRADLTGADCHGASLERVRATGVSAGGADFSICNLASADFTDSDFSSAILGGANCDSVDLTRVRLRLADFRRVLILTSDTRTVKNERGEERIEIVDRYEKRHVNLARVSWHAADLSWARLDDNVVKQLPPAVLHEFRHKLNIEGLTMSRTKIFVCHAHEDTAEALQLYDAVAADGFAPWIDKRDLQLGQDWKREIPLQIARSEAVIVCLSRVAISKRGYIQNEFRLALEELRQVPLDRIFILPVRLDHCEVPPEFARFQYVNLWEPGAMNRVLDSLRMLRNAGSTDSA